MPRAPANVVKLPEFKRQPGLWRTLAAMARGLGHRNTAPRRPNPFAPAQPLPGVIGEGRKPPQIAMDAAEFWKGALDQSDGPGADWGWAGAHAAGYAASAYSEGMEWLGYAILALLSQRAEYRTMVETFATEMTREWIVFKSKSDDKDQQKRIEQIEERLRELKFQSAMKAANVNDGFQGRGQIYIDTGEPDNRDELKLPLSDPKAVKAKYGRGRFITRLGAIEPMWCYPAAYEASDPLRANWYKPDLWWVMGKEVSRDRLLTFVGNEVPDLIKPAYSFGGIATTQMAKPYVDLWLRNRTSESDLLNNFSLRVLATELDVSTADEGSELFQRALTLNTLADNQGLLLINKASEEFSVHQTSLGGVAEITRQSMERMTIPSREPIVKFFGNQPSGLNADSEGVIRMWYDDIRAAQKSRNYDTMDCVIKLVQIELFDEVIDDITWEFKDLWQLDAAGKAAIQLTKAQIVQTDIASGVIDPEEGRLARAKDEDSPYIGLDLEEREAPGEEIEEQEAEAGGGFGAGKLINPKPQTSTSQRLARSVETQAAGFGGAASGGFAARDEFREADHPRVESGSAAGRFTKGAGAEGAAGGERVGDLRKARERVWKGKAASSGSTLAKHELGQLGEDIAMQWLRQVRGFDDAAALHVASSVNFPLDMVGDHEIFEVKTGISSSGTARWRITIGQPGKAETAWLKTATPAEKAAWNRAKIEKAIARKRAVVAEFSERYGREIAPKTIALIVDPESGRADIHVLHGFHADIGWNSQLARESYVGSYDYA